ncbi:MAG: four helix bundle protein [Anaerolineae bacterium]|nr:four helix bundle protein [Anaerolineae bacterium]
MNYDEWSQQVPGAITGDSLWKMEAYRLALFASDMGWFDTTKLDSDRRTRELSDQLYRSVGSIGANLAEGYSRGTGKDRARFYEYALGSARESRDWYYKGRYVLGDSVAQHRMNFMAQIIRLLLTMVPQQRGRTLREEVAIYQVVQEESNRSLLDELLIHNPLPD